MWAAVGWRCWRRRRSSGPCGRQRPPRRSPRRPGAGVVDLAEAAQRPGQGTRGRAVAEDLAPHRSGREVGVVDVDVEAGRGVEDGSDRPRLGGDAAGGDVGVRRDLGEGRGEVDDDARALAGAAGVDVGHGGRVDVGHPQVIGDRVGAQPDDAQAPAVRVARAADLPVTCQVRGEPRRLRRGGRGQAADRQRQRSEDYPVFLACAHRALPSTVLDSAKHLGDPGSSSEGLARRRVRPRSRVLCLVS